MQDWISATFTATSDIVARELYILLLAMLLFAAGLTWWRRGGEALAQRTLRRPSFFNLFGWWVAIAGLFLLVGYVLLGVLPQDYLVAAAAGAAAGVFCLLLLVRLFPQPDVAALALPEVESPAPVMQVSAHVESIAAPASLLSNGQWPTEAPVCSRELRIRERYRFGRVVKKVNNSHCIFAAYQRQFGTVKPRALIAEVRLQHSGSSDQAEAWLVHAQHEIERFPEKYHIRLRSTPAVYVEDDSMYYVMPGASYRGSGLRPSLVAHAGESASQYAPRSRLVVSRTPTSKHVLGSGRKAYAQVHKQQPAADPGSYAKAPEGDGVATVAPLPSQIFLPFITRSGATEQVLDTGCQEYAAQPARVHSVLVANTSTLQRLRGLPRHRGSQKPNDAGHERIPEPHGGR